MLRLIFILLLLGSLVYSAVAQEGGAVAFFDKLNNEAIIISQGDLITGDREMKKYVSNFLSKNGKNTSYRQEFNVSVNAKLAYEIGVLRTAKDVYPVMFLKNKRESGYGIELLIIYQEQKPEDATASLTSQRKKWMELCNAHKAGELVQEIYKSNALYYNRGRLLQGTESISSEFGYMNSPNYSLQLTPKQITFISSEIAYEIGQCSGSYPLPYMLLWEKQSDGNWKILLDSNY